MIEEWIKKWNIPPQAYLELIDIFTKKEAPKIARQPKTETHAMNLIAYNAAKSGAILWRNNVGALKDKNGRPVRFGLCNDTEALNEKFKSSDLIGITPVLVTEKHVGRTLGIFTAYEAKTPGWKYTAVKREQAQLNYLQLVAKYGGKATFSTGEF